MPEDTCGSVTRIVISIRGGDRAKVAPLWERYFERLTHHAAKYLRYARRSDYSEEDAALSVINDFCDGLARGKFDFVDSREVLWRTLATIIERKVLKRLRVKRFEKEIKFTDLQPDASWAGDGVSRMAVVEPTAEYREIVQIEIDELLGTLTDPRWRKACRMSMEGYTVREIGANFGMTKSCVHVWFRTIRAIWEDSPGRENLLG